MYCIGNSGICSYYTSDLILSVIKIIPLTYWYFVPSSTNKYSKVRIPDLARQMISYEMDRSIWEWIRNNNGISHQDGNGVQ